MTRYFFDCFDGRKASVDAYGVELADLAEVADQGAALAVELLRELAGNAEMAAVSVTVRSDAGHLVHQTHCTLHSLLLPAQDQRGSS